MPNTANQQNEAGIDINQALDILAQRTSEPNTHSHPENGDGVGCHHNAPELASEWGQRLDLGGGDDDTSDESVEARRHKLEAERAERRVQIEDALNSMAVKDLLGCVINSQQERVVCYRTYDRYVQLVAICDSAMHPANKIDFLRLTLAVVWMKC
jgi:hypothetical protein